MNTEINTINVAMEHQRVEYFAGQFLEEKDFKAEQKYHLMRRRRLNQELFSHGVRRGFAVKAEGPEQKALYVGSGAAMDYLGRELWLEKEQLLKFPPPEDGEYFLCMQVLEKLDEWINYSAQAPQPDTGPAAGSTSPWAGNTRNTETIEFSLIDTAHALEEAHIKLARVRWKDGCFSSIDDKYRHMSTASLGSGLTVNPSGHYLDMYYQGKLNAYIGANLDHQGPEGVTFSSASRMHLFAEEKLYILNKGGTIVGRDWDGGGSLIVQGPTTLQGGLNVIRREKETDGGTLTVQGPATLEGGLHVVRDVLIAKDPREKAAGKKDGNLTVQGMATVEESLNVLQDVVIKGSLQVTGGSSALSIAGAEFTYYAGDGERKNPGVKFSTKERMHISGEEELYLLHKKGVLIGKNWHTGSAESGSLTVQGATTLQGGLNVVRDVEIKKNAEKQGGNLTVHGMATVVEGLNVSQYAVVEGSLQVTDDINVNVSSDVKKRRMLIKGGDLKDQALSIAGAEFTYHPATFDRTDKNWKYSGMKLFAEERMHISGDEELYLLHKKGVVIGKDWYPDSIQKPNPDSGSLEVQGKATFKGLVLHSPGVYDNKGGHPPEITKKLKDVGDFLFFVEKGGQNKLLAYWRINDGPDGIKFTALGPN